MTGMALSLLHALSSCIFHLVMIYARTSPLQPTVGFNVNKKSDSAHLALAQACIQPDYPSPETLFAQALFKGGKALCLTDLLMPRMYFPDRRHRYDQDCQYKQCNLYIHSDRTVLQVRKKTHRPLDFNENTALILAFLFSSIFVLP